MRLWLPSLLALFGLGLLPVAGAQGLSDAADSLPDCATKCLMNAIKESDCEPTDQACICGDSDLQDQVTVCVMGSCTIKESMTTKNATERACNVPIRDRSDYLNTVATVIGAVTGAVVVFRLVYKLWAQLGWSLDDWFILATGACAGAGAAISIHGTGANGLGRDVWTLPFHTIYSFGYWFYIIAFTYFLELTLLKMSILFFYMRIFPEPKVRRVLWATQTLNAMFGIAYVFGSIFQCTPISYNWTRWDGESEGSCIDITALAWSNAIVSIVFDIWMLAIPLSQLRKLKLHWKRKVGVGVMFVVGTFVTVLSILRLRSLVVFAQSSDNPTWGDADVSNWSVIEIGVGTMCACLPTIRLALVRGFRVFRETTIDYGYGGKKSYRNSSFRNSSYRRQWSSSTRPGASRAAGVEAMDGDMRPETPGVMCQKSFAVEYNTQEDDSALVPMREFVISGGSSVKSGRSSRSV